MAYTIIRGGMVLDIRAGTAEPADILIEDDTIREVGPPGCAGARGSARDRGGAAADPSRSRQRAHPLARQSRQGDGRPLDARIAARRGAVDRRQSQRRRHPSVGADRRGRDGAERLHRAVTICFSNGRCRPATASPRSARPMPKSACARSSRRWSPTAAFTRRYPASPTPCRPPCASASRRCGWRPARRRWRRSATRCTTGRSTATMSARPSRRRSRIIARTTSSSAAPRWPAISISGCTAMSPSRRCRPWRACGFTAAPRPRISTGSACIGPHFTVAHGVWLDHDDMARLGDQRRLGRAQPGQQHAARLRAGRYQGDARPRGSISGSAPTGRRAPTTRTCTRRCGWPRSSRRCRGRSGGAG